MMYVYIAGPLSSSGNYLENVRRAVKMAEKLLKLGFIPYVPHLAALWQMMSPHREYEYWLPLDFAWIDKCDAILLLPGYSRGGEEELKHAKGKSLFVARSVRQLVQWREERYRLFGVKERL